jgi:hypothetical protein
MTDGENGVMIRALLRAGATHTAQMSNFIAPLEISSILVAQLCTLVRQALGHHCVLSFMLLNDVNRNHVHPHLDYLKSRIGLFEYVDCD